MERVLRIFISYKTGPNTGLTFQANVIREKLEAKGYDVWMDTSDLEAGVDWNTQIYTRIPESDILLLLLAGETSMSNWVRREIDVAKGAKVTILPVLIRGDFDKQEALDKLDIPRLQFVSLLTGSEQEYKILIEAIENLKDQTRQKQEEWLKLLREGEKVERHTPETPNKSKLVFRMKEQGPKCHPEIHLAVGDIIRMRDIDVIVNPENDYMQMARIFETKTMSSLLRYHGSYIDKAWRLLDDTIQDELNEKVKKLFKYRPVGNTTVITTSAGHPQGWLRKRVHARFIFHTATYSVQGSGRDKWLEPIKSDSGMRMAVKNTLEKVLEVDNLKGVISPKNCPAYKEQETNAENYEPIKSVILPLFGTGQGGRPIEETTRAFVMGIKEFLIDNVDNEDLKLERIHFCVYYEDQVSAVESALKDEFELVESKPSPG